MKKINLILTNYFFLLLIFIFYSYFLVDPNFTLFNHSLWTDFRNFVINIGYYRRDLSWMIYLFLILLLFFFHHQLTKNYQKLNLRILIFSLGFLTLFSYPFLSHDFFNYMFDARIFTYYNKNPYLYKALDFPSDSWLRFMHWTHRSYPYGPVFLLISFLPSFLSFGKFILNFFLFKLIWIMFFIVSIYLLNKLNKKWAVFFATHPLVIIEGLINAHNDLVALSLAIFGIYLLVKEKKIFSRILFLLSAGIKYLTIPLLFLSKKNKKINQLIFIFSIVFVLIVSFFGEIQPWYFLSVFVFLPIFTKLIEKLNIFFAGLLFSYYPYIRLGGWDSVEKINLKHWIIFFGFLINIFYLIGVKLKFNWDKIKKNEKDNKKN